MLKNKYFMLSIFFVVLFSCSEDNSTPDSSDNYNRVDLLSNLVNNIIIPSHQNFDDELGLFENSLNAFIDDRSLSNLEELQMQFVETYKAWQHIEMFNIGYAEEIYYASKMNIYPANVSRINENINSNNIDLDNNPNQFSAQGFPAIDYLLFGIAGDTNETILSIYTQDQQNNLTLNYLTILIQKMITNTDSVIDYWEQNKDDFINSSGNTSSSSLNMLANDFVYYYEKGLRANKIGIPAGVWSGEYPDKVEAYFKGDISKLLTLEALEACDKFFRGIHFNAQTDGEGLYDYLAYLDDTNYSDSSMFIGLQDDITSSFDNSVEKVNSLNDNFSTQILTENIKMLEAFDVIQQGVVRLKTNMLSILGISVDYYDADGD